MLDDKWFTDEFIREQGIERDYGEHLLLELFENKLTIYDLTREQFVFVYHHRNAFTVNIINTLFAIVCGDLMLNCDKERKEGALCQKIQ